MEREITLSSFPVRNVGNNRPGDFTTKFSPEIDLRDKNASYYVAFNRIISQWLLHGPILTLDMLTKK